jgi:hypothetical protein
MLSALVRPDPWTLAASYVSDRRATVGDDAGIRIIERYAQNPPAAPARDATVTEVGAE